MPRAKINPVKTSGTKGTSGTTASVKEASRPGMVPHVIHPTAVYWLEDAKRIFGLRTSTVRREVREGRLRIGKRSNRYVLLGSWLLEWIESSEIRRRKKVARAGDSVEEAVQRAFGE